MVFMRGVKITSTYYFDTRISTATFVRTRAIWNMYIQMRNNAKISHNLQFIPGSLGGYGYLRCIKLIYID